MGTDLAELAGGAVEEMSGAETGLLRTMARSPVFLPLGAAFAAVLTVRVVLAPLPAGPAGADPATSIAPSSLAMLMLAGAIALVWALSEAAAFVSRWSVKCRTMRWAAIQTRFGR